MTFDPIPVIAAMRVAASSGLSELRLALDGLTIEISRQGDPREATPTDVAEPAPKPVAPARTAGTEVAAPLAGICHLTPAPEAAPFVTVGARVEAGQTLCLIEAMKMMTPIPAPRSGRVTEIALDNGDPVEAGALLMRMADD